MDLVSLVEIAISHIIFVLIQNSCKILTNFQMDRVCGSISIYDPVAFDEAHFLCHPYL
jgi:hypothetical protein